jgi:type IVB pilus formation R64 PilN family outer membrane protein
MRLNSWKALVAMLATTLLLVSCYPGYQETIDQIDNTKATIDESNQKDMPPPPPVMEKRGAYVDITPVSLTHPPYWLDQMVTIHGANLPVTFYVEQVLAGTDAEVQYNPGVNRGKLISMDYRGTIKGALRQIANKSNYYYNIDNKTGSVHWSAFTTKTFDVSFLPGAAKYEVGGKQNSNSSGQSGGNNGGSSNSGSGGVTINYTGVDLSATDQYSSLEGDISIWRDLESTVKSLLSPEGRVTVSQSTTTITVSDHPQNVAAVGNYIKKMNQELSKQVRILVQVVSVQLSKNYEYGINWDVVRNFTHGTISFVDNLASNAAVANSFSPMQLIFSATSGKWAGTNTVIEALSQQGKVGVVTQPTVTTLNNQVAEISIQSQQSYIQSISNSQTQTSSTSGVNPGVVTTGFNLYLLPKIQNQKIFLQVSTTLSNLESLQEINASTGATCDQATPDGCGSTTPTAGTNVIQIPAVSERRFNQRSVIPNGATLILTGFKQRSNTANQSSLLYTGALGARGGEDVVTELVLLITPEVLNSGNSY